MLKKLKFWVIQTLKTILESTIKKSEIKLIDLENANQKLLVEKDKVNVIGEHSKSHTPFTLYLETLPKQPSKSMEAFFDDENFYFFNIPEEFSSLNIYAENITFAGSDDILLPVFETPMFKGIENNKEMSDKYKFFMKRFISKQSLNNMSDMKTPHIKYHRFINGNKKFDVYRLYQPINTKYEAINPVNERINNLITEKRKNLVIQ